MRNSLVENFLPSLIGFMIMPASKYHRTHFASKSTKTLKVVNWLKGESATGGRCNGEATLHASNWILQRTKFWSCSQLKERFTTLIPTDPPTGLIFPATPLKRFSLR